MEFRFMLQRAGWLREIDRIYEDGLEFGLNEFYSTLKDRIHDRTPVDCTSGQGKKKDFGEHLQESWDLLMTGRSAVIGTFKEYAVILEKGDYPGVGPRTEESEGGIYSRQAVGGIIEPLLADEKLMNDAFETVVRELDGRLDELLERR